MSLPFEATTPGQNVSPSPMLSPPPTSGSSMESHPSWPVLSTLQVRMKVALPLHGFCVRDLLSLVTGNVVISGWNETEDVPLIGGVAQISWCEFETVDDRIAVRLTRLI